MEDKTKTSEGKTLEFYYEVSKVRSSSYRWVGRLVFSVILSRDSSSILVTLKTKHTFFSSQDKAAALV